MISQMTILDAYFMKVASGDISFANIKNCAQFFIPGPQSFGRSSLPAGHATEVVTSRLSGIAFKHDDDKVKIKL